MNLTHLRNFTPARVALGRAGDSIPTRELLDFQLAHARARDAVYAKLDLASLMLDGIFVASAAMDRTTFLRRPDLGRKLNEQFSRRLTKGDYDVGVIIADGLSALAVHRHAKALLDEVIPRLSGWRLGPIVIAEQARVALGDEIGQRLGARMAVVLIGERPGLSSPDSLGIYLTWDPKPGRTDAERNCISNIRTEGLSYSAAADSLVFLMTEARQRRLSGVDLKDASLRSGDLGQDALA